MGAAESTPQSPTGGLLVARTRVLERASEELDINIDDVDLLLKKLGMGTAQSSPVDTLHFTCRALRDTDLKVLGVLATLQPTGVSAITSINLAHNSIGNDGASALGRALTSGAPALRRLQLHENRIGDEGFAAIARATKPGGAPHVQSLRIEFNRIGDAGIAALAEAWEDGGGLELTELHAAGNEITSVGLQALAPQLERAPRLRALAFGSASGGNRIGDDGARALAEALRSQPTRPHGALTISLRTNSVTPAGEAELSAALKALGSGPDAVNVTFDSLSSSRALLQPAVHAMGAINEMQPSAPPLASVPEQAPADADPALEA